jgi:hypothetical protein
MNAINRYLLSSTLAACVLAAPALAQETRGGIIGDAAPGTVVELRNLGSNQQIVVKARKNGRFEALKLAIGTYSVTLSSPDGSTRGPIFVQVHAGGLATRVPAEDG